MDETPSAVFTSVGQSEQSATVIADAKNDGVNNHDQYPVISGMLNPPTMMNTIGNQTIGDTGLNNEINGDIAAINTGLNPHKIPIGMAIAVAIRKPRKTQARLVRMYMKNVGG